MRFPTRLTSWLTPPAKARRRNRAHRNHLHLEALESRVVPAILPAPNPIFPIHGEVNLLSVIQKHADKQNLNAQDHFPVPYTIVVSAGGAAPTIKNWKAGAPVRLDADQSLATGKGGHDIQLEVNTDKYVNGLGETDWRMRLNVNRIDSGSHAQNLSVVIAFPFDAFNKEALPGAPNILMGFQTRLPGTPGQQDYVTGIDGGVAPATMQMVLTPHVLAGTTHDFEWTVDTTGAANPITFLSGEFDGNPGSNSILNALGWSAYVQNVPAHIGAEIKVAENAIGSAAVDSKMDLHWTASSRSLTAFGYVEAESAGAASSPTTANYVTAIVAEQMPTDERFILHHNEAAGTLTLDHTANAGTTEMTFLKRRSDGLALTGVAADDTLGVEAVPAGVDLTLGLGGYMSLDVSANTLDLHVQATQTGGFNNTAQFFQQYNLEYTALRVKNAPDLTAAFDGAATKYAIDATNPGESIPWAEMVIDDNGRISATNAALNLELPGAYGLSPAWHLWSIIDDGTHGTAVARVLDNVSARFDHDVICKETVEFQSTAEHPAMTYLRTGAGSLVQPPVDDRPDPNIEVTGEIENILVGRTWVELQFPVDLATDTTQAIGNIEHVCMFGHIGWQDFAGAFEGIPKQSDFEFRPDGEVKVLALDAASNPSNYDMIAIRLSNSKGFNPAVVKLPDTDMAGEFAYGFHAKNETFFPGGTKLKDAAIRLDFARASAGRGTTRTTTPTWTWTRSSTTRRTGTSAACSSSSRRRRPSRP